jgi:hypothetical protein
LVKIKKDLIEGQEDHKIIVIVIEKVVHLVIIEGIEMMVLLENSVVGEVIKEDAMVFKIQDMV